MNKSMKNLFFLFPFLQWFIIQRQRRYRWKESKFLSMDSFSNMKVCLLPWINKNKISSSILSKNGKAIHYLEANQDEIFWSYLSGNVNAIHLLEANQDKIFWPSWPFALLWKQSNKKSTANFSRRL